MSATVTGLYLANYTVVSGATNPASGATFDMNSNALVGFPTPVGLSGDSLSSYLVSSVNLVPAGYQVDDQNNVTRFYEVDTRGLTALSMLADAEGGLPFTWVGELPAEPGGIVRQLVKCDTSGTLEATLQRMKETLHLVLPVSGSTSGDTSGGVAALFASA